MQDFNDFIGKLSERITEIDETIPELPVKDVVSDHSPDRDFES